MSEDARDRRQSAAEPPVHGRGARLRGLPVDAARNGDTPMLRTAVEAGVPVNLTNDKGDTLLTSPRTSSGRTRWRCCWRRLRTPSA
ncbi:hypothetical protein QJS66_06260 [Kocuria rhizophila]|nr:hypothetical protein QJS66_06260 [Kocuria rhizophila]